MVVPPDPRGEQTSESGIQKPRRTDGWVLFVVGAVVVVGLLGHLLNRQRTSREEPDSAPVQGTQRESVAVPATETQRHNDGSTAEPAAVVYVVTHKHRLIDCHGTLTFTRRRLQFDSDGWDESFIVPRDEVTIEGEVVRIFDRRGRFEFSDDVRVERLFRDWKAGTLPPVPAQ